MVRSMSLESGVTPRRLNQVVLPEPGSPIASTTTPLGARCDFTGGCPVAAAGAAGGWVGDSGWVSIWMRRGCGAAAGGGGLTLSK